MSASTIPGCWISTKALPAARSHAPVISFQNRLYVFGGGGAAFKSLNETFIYDPQQDIWDTARPMPTLRSGTVAALYQNAIYIMGGGYKQDNGQFRFLTTVDIYYPQEDRWEKGPDLIKPHDYPASFSHDHYIYVMGGHHPEAYKEGPKTDPGFDFCERLNLLTGQWEEIAPLLTPRFALAGVNLNGILLTLGGVAFSPAGFHNFDFVEVYDPHKNLWHRDSTYQLPWQAAGMGAHSEKQQLYVFGGYSGEGIHARAAVFSTTSGQWQLLPPMPTPRAAMGVAACQGKIYLIGGWADDGRTPMADVCCFVPNAT